MRPDLDITVHRYRVDVSMRRYYIDHIIVVHRQISGGRLKTSKITYVHGKHHVIHYGLVSKDSHCYKYVLHV